MQTQFRNRSINIDIPSKVVDMLNAIRDSAPEAIIAGGYLRDLDHGIQPRDIDVFVPFNADLYNARMHLGATGILGDDCDQYEGDDTISMQQHWNLMATPSAIPLEVNILFCQKDIQPLQRLSRFDFGLCQIAFDSHRIIMTDGYLTDKENRTFTLQRFTGYNAHQNSLARFERLTKRYKSYYLRVPPHIRELMNVDTIEYQP